MIDKISDEKYIIILFTIQFLYHHFRIFKIILPLFQCLRIIKSVYPEVFQLPFPLLSHQISVHICFLKEDFRGSTFSFHKAIHQEVEMLYQDLSEEFAQEARE